jgi:hypothetical protein
MIAGQLQLKKRRAVRALGGSQPDGKDPTNVAPASIELGSSSQNPGTDDFVSLRVFRLAFPNHSCDFPLLPTCLLSTRSLPIVTHPRSFLFSHRLGIIRFSLHFVVDFGAGWKFCATARRLQAKSRRNAQPLNSNVLSGMSRLQVLGFMKFS